MNRSLWTALCAGAALSAVACYRIATLSLVFGSREGHWVYEYLYGFSSRSMVVGAMVCVAGAALLALPARVVRRREWWLVALWLVMGTTAQVRLRALAPYSIGRMFASDGSNGFYGATQQYPASVALRNFDGLRQTLTIHPRSNMPGKLALVYGLEVVSKNPDMLALLVIVMSNAGGLLLYLFVRDLSGDAVTAMMSLAFYLFVPSKLFFFPILNTVTPVAVLACLWLWLRVLKTRAAAYSVALGGALFLLALFEPLPLVSGIIFAGMAAGAVIRDEIRWGLLARHTLIVATAFVAVYLAVRLWLGLDLFGVFRHLLGDAVEFNTVAQRPYGIWVWRNLLDFAIGAGFCQVMLLAAVMPAGWREPVIMFSASLAAAILITDLLGVNRGEVVRLWIFFACLLQIPAAAACARLENRLAGMTVLASSLLVGTLGTSMMNFAQP